MNDIIEDRTTNADATYLRVSELREALGADIAVYMYAGSSGSAGQISSFEFSHNQERKRSMFLIRVGKGVTDDVMEELRGQEHITLVRRIRI